MIFLLVFSVTAKHCYQDQCQGALPLFSSNTFTVLGLTKVSLYSFKLIFMSGIRAEEDQFHSSVRGYLIFPMPFTEKTVLS